MSGLASFDRRRGPAFVAVLLAATATGGCGGGESDTSSERRHSDTRLGGGQISKEQLQEEVPQRNAVPRPEK